MSRKQVLAAMGLAGVMVFSGAVMPGDMTVAGPATAEAGFMNNLGDIGDKLKSSAKDAGKKAAKDAAKKAFHVDIDAMQNKRQDLIENLRKAADCYALAYAHTKKGLEMGDGGESALAAMYQLNRNPNLGSIKAVVAETKLDKKATAEAARNILDSGDQARIDAAKAYLKDAKVERRAANVYKALALRDAAFIIKDAATALAKGGDTLEDKLNIIKDLSNFAKESEPVAKEIGTHHNDMAGALKEFEKKQNIGDVSDAEAKKMSAAWLEE